MRKKNRIFGKPVLTAISLMIALLPALSPGISAARDNGDDNNRSEFYGIVEARPESGLQGKWLIGGRAYATDAGTEFDQTEGELTIGGCAKVKMRGGRVHEIDSEPLQDCR